MNPHAPPFNAKPPAGDQGQARIESESASNLPGPSAAVNPDSETIALLSEAVWLLTAIHNLLIEQLNTLQDVKRRMP